MLLGEEEMRKKKGHERKAFLTIYRCPSHKGFVTVCIENEGGGGIRYLGGKCCVNMYKDKLASWDLEHNKEYIKELANDLLDHLD